jgi:hypothetical protein
MSGSNLIRWSGLAAMLGGTLFVIAELLGLSRLGYTRVSESLASGVFPVEAALVLLGAILGLMGLVGLYVNQSRATGFLGLVGFLGSFAGLALVAGVAWADVFILPYLAKAVPALIDERFIGLGGFVLSYLLAGLGGVLFGVATLRGRVYPRPAALLFTVGAALAIVGGLLGVPLLSIIFDVGVAWLGLALWTGRIGEQAQQPARVK